MTEQIISLNDPKVMLVIIPGLILAINEFLKRNGMPDKYCPIVNVILGTFSIYPLQQLGLNLLPAIIGSLIIGLSAGGFYDFKRLLK